ncbi:TPA: hypothetical protein ACPURN_002037 [Klebsiella pneumoniae]
MNELQKQGAELRTKAKELALAVLAKHPDGQKNGKGILNNLKYSGSAALIGEQNQKQLARISNIGL